MHTVKYVHWQDDDAWIGYLEEYPDYWTQGDSMDDLLEHLRSYPRSSYPMNPCI